jgi:hypothetical protein
MLETLCLWVRIWGSYCLCVHFRSLCLWVFMFGVTLAGVPILLVHMQRDLESCMVTGQWFGITMRSCQRSRDLESLAGSCSSPCWNPCWRVPQSKSMSESPRGGSWSRIRERSLCLASIVRNPCWSLRAFRNLESTSAWRVPVLDPLYAGSAVEVSGQIPVLASAIRRSWFGISGRAFLSDPCWKSTPRRVTSQIMLESYALGQREVSVGSHLYPASPSRSVTESYAFGSLSGIVSDPRVPVQIHVKVLSIPCVHNQRNLC